MQDNKIIVLKVNFIVLLFSSVPSVAFYYTRDFLCLARFSIRCVLSGILITDCRYKEENMNNELLSTKMPKNGIL